MKTTREKIEVMQAYERGEQIQIYYSDTDEWEDVEATPLWDWVNYDYRVKPKFKDGDILFATSLNNWIFIFKENENKESIYKYVAVPICTFDTPIYINDAKLFDKEYVSEIRFATEEEKQKLFDILKENNYHWDAKTKTLEKLIEPKFKVGDVIQNEHGIKVKITNISYNAFYEYQSITTLGQGVIFLSNQNEWELVPNKFDLTTLKPFDKVLVRDENGQKWICDIFSYYDDNPRFPFWGVGRSNSKQCIPYKGNEHLLGTTNDCDDFYINW